MNFFNQHNLKAAGIHLCISILIALLCILLVYGLWYPSPLDAALGVGSIFLLLLAVDLSLGPLLTLVVFKPNKSSIKFDLTVIACVQVAALMYGMYTVGSARPAYLVFTNTRFDLVQAHEVADIAGTTSHPTLAMQSPWAQPLLGYKLRSATIPRDTASTATHNLIMSSALNGGPDIPNVAAYQDEYALALQRIQAASKSLNTQQSKNATVNARIIELQSKYPKNTLIAPLKIKYTVYTVFLDPTDASILGIEAIDLF